MSRLSVAEIRGLIDAVVEACPELGGADVSGLCLRVLDVSGKTLAGIERTVDLVGRQTDETMLAIMQVGAMRAVLADFPEGDDRRKLLAAGERVGEMMAKKWGEKVREELARRMGPPS